VSEEPESESAPELRVTAKLTSNQKIDIKPHMRIDKKSELMLMRRATASV